MAFPVIACFLAGGFLGLRFRYSSLFPAIALAVAVVAAAGFAGGETLRWTLIAMASTTISLQLGYFCGVLLRLLKPSALIAPDRKVPPQTFRREGL